MSGFPQQVLFRQLCGSGAHNMTSLQLPRACSVVSVSVIDTTAWAYKVPCANLFYPRYPGLETFDLCSYAFLITHGTGTEKRQLLFDLGIRKDWTNLVPDTVQKFKKWGTQLEVKKDVLELLSENNFDPAGIESIIWRSYLPDAGDKGQDADRYYSHLHWDHTGNPAKFPSSVKLLVGPGIKDKYMPGWPKNPNAEFREEDIAGREVVEITKDHFNETVAGMPAFDYFGDGSFYILNAPGHSLGHLNALACTSNDPESYFFLAADSVHLGGELRPSSSMRLPETVDVPGLVPQPCPRQILLELHPKQSATTPYLGLDSSFPEHLKDAERTIEFLQSFDADERVLVLFTHDVSIFDMLEFFPRLANDWREKGWKEKGRWKFLAHLQQKSRGEVKIRN